MVEILTNTLSETSIKTTRNWKSYDAADARATLEVGLNGFNVKCLDMNVQDHWNVLESILVDVVDKLAPLFTQIVKINNKKKVVPRNIKQKINKRKRLVRANLRNSSPASSSEIRLLNGEIKSYFAGIKIGNVRSAASGGGANLWKAVKLAKNLVANELPSDLTLGRAPVAPGDVANSFARHFSEKIKLNVSKTSLYL